MAPRETAPSSDRLLELIGGMAGQRVVMVADLVVDRFITGTARRISREAPVLILSYEGERSVPGGGANAAANVAALGGRPLLLGAVGDDDSGRALLAALEAMGISTAGVLVTPGYHTPTKTRILGGSRHGIKQQIVRYDVEERLELTPEDEEHFVNLARHEASQAGAAIVSDYGYGAAPPRLLRRLRGALRPETPILADSRYRLAELKGVDGATPNEEEAEALYGRPLGDEPREVAEAGRELRDRLGASHLMITRGSRGMTLVEEGSAAHLPVHGTDQVADVTGAGDTVLGTFALALAAGATPLEAALLADYAGGVVVMKMGTATLTPDELRAAVHDDPAPREELRWVAW